ncbi:hypothetical protein ScFU53_03470 [Streptococcus canis]|nr:hypothetical protein ScFU1_09990 [Streptococcus canis]GFE48079.1 hypothetical protein ScFU129_17100 [Streptococcus canis]GFG41492.1 hypothetical protein ScFU29_03960 [Streptococcus canis]GFG43335.1 hypothetical protein ScFU53_03470 [Streptococcus canis]GFG45764.1 hypothetical protein ScFU93_10100 [Streptococcus canis]
MLRYKKKKSIDEVFNVAFGENGPRKKTTFEKVTMVVVILMVLVTVGGLIASALSVLM